MNSKIIITITLIFVILLSGCELSGMNITSPTPAPVITFTPAIKTSTPNITEYVTLAPTGQSNTATPLAATETESGTPTDNPQTTQNKQDIEAFLPSLETRLDFYGIAETGHYGSLTQVYSDDHSALYEFNGIYNDGMGVADKFTIQYFCDFQRGTVTEKALYNERLDKNEFHSKLHNIVILKLPLSLGATWSHETTIEGSKYWVYAQVIEYDETDVKVLYTAPNVPQYHDEAYIEMRTYEIGYGMTSFGNIMPGELDMTGINTSDEDVVQEYIMNMYMFGYSLYK